MPAVCRAGRSDLFQQRYWLSTKVRSSEVSRSKVCSGRQAIRPGLVVAVLNALHDAGDADFYELVEVGGGDREKLDPLEQGIAEIFGLLQDPPVESQPGLIAAEKELLSLWLSCGHRNGM